MGYEVIYEKDGVVVANVDALWKYKDTKQWRDNPKLSEAEVKKIMGLKV